MSVSSVEFTQEEKEVLLKQAMENCGAYIVSYLTALCRDPHIAEDLAQDLWVYVYKKYSPLDYGHVGYLKNKAKQLWIDSLRKQGRRPDLDFERKMASILVEAKCPEPSTPEEETELFTNFWESFEDLNLTPEQKRIFWLKERYGLTLDDVSAKLGIARSTAYDRLKLVKQLCREHLTQTTE